MAGGASAVLLRLLLCLIESGRADAEMNTAFTSD
jgi:hypothetical protein